MRIFSGWWQRHFLFYEGFFVLVLGAPSVVYGYRFGGNSLMDGVLGENRENVYGALVTVFSSLLGFAIAATSIIVGLANSGRLEIVSESGAWNNHWKVLFDTIRWLGVAPLLSLIALVFDKPDSPVFWAGHAILIVTAMVTVRL